MGVFAKGLFAAGLAAFAGLSAAAFANSNPPVIRWTGVEDADASLAHVLGRLSQQQGRAWSTQDFLLQEDRDLAFNHYRRYVELLKGVPVHGRYIRTWTDLGAGKAVQVEADLDAVAPETDKAALDSLASLSSEKTAELARAAVRADSEDPYTRGMQWSDEWLNGELVRTVKVRGKRGTHLVRIGASKLKVISREYREFPQADEAQGGKVGEMSIPVQVFPIYEESDGSGKQLPRVAAELKHVLTQTPQVGGDIYAPLKTQRYFDSKEDFVLGATDAGQAQGYWSMAVIKDKAAAIRAALPLASNDFSAGLLLQGRYATINIHPDAFKKWGPVGFDAVSSPAFFPNWNDTTVDGKDVSEMIPSTAFAGKPLRSAQEAWDRPARRLPDHDPKAYLSDGFDELQVYYAIDTLFEQLQLRGWKDPELSTRPFNAFLFNPDIAMQDNAFYTDDTINFTTYTPDAQNFARDNSTIWHELGHGVMDRLMGDNIELADTGGLSEGMADFVAAMVIRAVTQGVPFEGSDDFRIINKTGFYLTNEVHDDGEAYGGTMKDFMDAVIARDGQRGLDKVADVVLEAMRLTRDHPGLTAPEWFKHILFADSLGRAGVRAPGELAPLLLQALASRNFKLDGGVVASFPIVNTATGVEVVAGKPGSRSSPINVKLPKDGTASFELSASLKGSDQFVFKYPAQIRVVFNGGPLQGAIHWVGEEKGPLVFTLNSESDTVKIPLQITGTCDRINREDGTCVDYAYVQAWNAGETRKPTAKKRFYLHLKNR